MDENAPHPRHRSARVLVWSFAIVNKNALHHYKEPEGAIGAHDAYNRLSVQGAYVSVGRASPPVNCVFTPQSSFRTAASFFHICNFCTRHMFMYVRTVGRVTHPTGLWRWAWSGTCAHITDEHQSLTGIRPIQQVAILLQSCWRTPRRGSETNTPT